MNSAFPEIYVVRHGETEWSASGRHTGRTDIPLTAKGEEAARGVADRLKGLTFQAVWSSPSRRAFQARNPNQIAAKAIIPFCPYKRQRTVGMAATKSQIASSASSRSSRQWRAIDHARPTPKAIIASK